MGVNHWKTGGTRPQNLEWGNANANCPPDFVIFQNFKHQIACITIAVGGALKTYQPHNSDSAFNSLLHIKVDRQRPQYHHFRRKIQHFTGEDTDKKYRSEFTKTRHFN